MQEFQKIRAIIEYNATHNIVTQSQLVADLVVSSWVSQNQESWLAESCLELVGESSRRVTPSDSISTSVLSKFQNGSLTIRPSRLDNDVLGILNPNNDSGSHLQLVPRLPKIDDVNP